MRLNLVVVFIHLAVFGSVAATQHGNHAGHGMQPADARHAVTFPEPMRTHTLSNMRDRLLALQEIQQALAGGGYDRTADITEKRLGLTSLQSHDAHDVAKFMPKGMQSMGTEVHPAASRFSTEAVNVGATGNIKPAPAALATITQQCVACHAAYRLK